MEDKTVASADLAELIGISPRRVRKLTQDGVLKTTARGQYDLRTAIGAYVRYLQTMARETGFKTVNIDIQTARARIVQANAEEAEIKLAVLKREAIAIADIEELWLQLYQNFKANLIASSQRIAQEVASETSERKIAQLLKDEAFRVLDELSRTPIPTNLQERS